MLLAQLERGDIDAAILVWEEALNLDPDNPRTRGNFVFVVPFMMPPDPALWG